MKQWASKGHMARVFQWWRFFIRFTSSAVWPGGNSSTFTISNAAHEFASIRCQLGSWYCVGKRTNQNLDSFKSSSKSKERQGGLIVRVCTHDKICSIQSQHNRLRVLSRSLLQASPTSAGPTVCKHQSLPLRSHTSRPHPVKVLCHSH